MNYLKCLFFNFLTVFFANHILPGIEVINQTKLPHLGGDIPFAVGLGFLNSLIYPVLKLTHCFTIPHLAIVSIVLNFAAYAVLKFLPIGIHISSIEGYLFPAILVTVISFITNYYEMKGNHPPPPTHL